MASVSYKVIMIPMVHRATANANGKRTRSWEVHRDKALTFFGAMATDGHRPGSPWVFCLKLSEKILDSGERIERRRASRYKPAGAYRGPGSGRRALELELEEQLQCMMRPAPHEHRRSTF